CSATDLDGNSGPCTSQGFTTSSTADTTPPVVTATNPVNGNANAPTNAFIEIMFNKALRSTSLGSITLSAGGTVSATAVLNSSGHYTDDTVVRLIPQQLLLPNTTYMV